MTPQDFIRLLGPAARESSKVTGIPPSFTVAQGALESGWGTSGLFVKANNIFGLKTHKTWKGDVISIPTKEYINGAWVVVPADWRKYPDIYSCLVDRGAFLHSNPRYNNCWATKDPKEFAQLLASDGYATDPDYVAKIISIITKYNLLPLDSMEAEDASVD